MLLPFAETKIKPMITVVLGDGDDTYLKPFKCSVCGHVAFEYYNRVNMVIAGARGMTSAKQPIVVQCPGRIKVYDDAGQQVSGPCKTKYWII